MNMFNNRYFFFIMISIFIYLFIDIFINFQIYKNVIEILISTKGLSVVFNTIFLNIILLKMFLFILILILFTIYFYFLRRILSFEWFYIYIKSIGKFGYSILKFIARFRVEDYNANIERLPKNVLPKFKKKK